jgi:DNA-binding CsgD family transcriptional regulator/predicted hydrolase (HD superfamily)
VSVVPAASFRPANVASATRSGRAIVGRSVELEAISAAIDDARESMVGISLEGEPGIGKTTLLGAAAEQAAAKGMLPLIAVADEEIHGPLLVARSIFGSEELRAECSDRVKELISAVDSALQGTDDSLGLPPDERLMRAFDKAATAMRAITRERPIALLLDDVQWADQDSIRLLRYVIRANPNMHMFLMFTIRPEEMAKVTELVTLLADLERLGILRRLRVERLRQTETAALLRNVLGGDVAPATAATIHAQAEGVPFIVSELTRTYREAGLLQPIGGTWALARNAERLVPSAVRTLISRRAANLKAETKDILAMGAVLGRAFRLADVCAIRAKMGETIACEIGEASDLVAPAVAAGLVTEGGTAGERYLAFSHEQVRAYALDTLSSTRRRQVHLAVLDVLTEGGEPAPESLSVIVRHALAAGDTDRIARYSLDAARAALAANAPEEALRIVEDALVMVSQPTQRVEMLQIRDDALGALGRTAERLESITELMALVEAAGDDAQQLDGLLRRAAALRGDRRFEAAADVARRARAKAAAAGNLDGELRACLELGQDLLRTALGEGYTPSALEADLDGGEEAYARAAAIAEQLGNESALAMAVRELGVIKLAGIREWFVERVKAGDHIAILQAVGAGVPLEELAKTLPIADLVDETRALLTRALELFERVGDRRGAMSSIVSLAYLQWAPEMHLGTNPAQRFEGIRQLANTMDTLVAESERETNEAQMLYGVHVFARSKLIPDLAIQRGEEAFQRARALGDNTLEFLAAIGTTHAYLELGDADTASQWLARASAAAATAPTPHRARQLGIADALLAADRGDVERMRSGLTEAARTAGVQRRPAAQCEAVALLALQTARAGAKAGDEALLATADSAAAEARRLCADLAGHPVWAAQAAAAAAEVALARGNSALALEMGRTALAEYRAAMNEDPHLEIVLPAARAILASSNDEAEKEGVRGWLRLIQALALQRTFDEVVRVRWLRGPLGRQLAELAGPFEGQLPTSKDAAQPDFDEKETRLLRLLTEGKTNSEIAGDIGVDEAAVSSQLTALYARIGTASRAEATAFAFRAPV